MGHKISTTTKLLIAVLGLVLYLINGRSKKGAATPAVTANDDPGAVGTIAI